MADEEKQEQLESGISFERVTENFNVAGGARREPPKVTVSRTGAIRSNVAGKEFIQAFIQEQGQNPEDFELVFGGNQALGALAVYAGKPGESGLMKAAIYPYAVGFHAGAAFTKFPNLRPVTKVECPIRRSVDRTGVPCLLINILGGTPTRTVKRKKLDDQSWNE